MYVRRDNLALYVAAVLLLVTAVSRAQEAPAQPASKWYDRVSVHGFLDGYYAWNDNSPRSHESFIPGTGTTAKRANELNLNLAAIDIVSDPKPVGFHLSLVAGNGADVVHAGEPKGTAIGKDVYRHIYQASLSYNAPIGKGLLIEAGVYPSHIGYEAFYSKDNWSYTRGWLTDLSPFYQTGVKASYSFNSHWSGQFHVMNGWQIIGENNNGKSVGTQIAYAGDRLSASFNTFAGPELANDSKHLRMFGDLVATWKATAKLSLGASIDRGRQALPDDAAANWLGVAGYAHYAIDNHRAFAVRIERFRDPDNGISGTGQTLSEATLTYELRPVDNLILKFEGRHDHSTANVFGRGTDRTSPNQTLIVISAVAVF